MTAYYNDTDPYCAAWLGALIAAKLIPQGDVDTRSIEDVIPHELSPYAQCHFFAGLGGWSRALTLAGFPADREVWTGSCPCQPFSQAGKGAGFADERHLWPAWHQLIRVRRPPIIFGEQVASQSGLAWFDLVQADLEGASYAVGSADLSAAGVGALHIRQRLWWVALADSERERLRGERPSSFVGTPAGMQGANEERERFRLDIGAACSAVADTDIRERAPGGAIGRMGWEWFAKEDRAFAGGGWSLEPDVGRVAHGVPARVAKLRALGNAIVPQVAEVFIRAVMGVP